MSSSDRIVYRDSSGFATFSQGDVGGAHVAAHQMLEARRFEQGFRALTDFLQQRNGEGSEWIHLHWHAAVFAIEVGRPTEALERYRRFIEPSVPELAALTDAPSLLWRLAIEGLDLDWEPVRKAAAAATSSGGDPYVELHHAMAFAGARDLMALDAWVDEQLGRRLSSTPDAGPSALLGVAYALRLFASHDFSVAGRLLEQTSNQVTDLGGSWAQNALFGQIAERALRQATVN